MKIGIILGVILGLLLLIVGGVGFFVAKKSGKKCKWCVWVLLAGVCALITAGANALRFLM
ncbi:hypothetical protein JK636_17790 [Clostridium sp. YIM B02515]|uniref:Uncharacterized protein n=1 Tax=Clostridium rhizosphaerae TaxID=2803861 RepID=A0ABS1TEA6_9CLOT|nr:hypothetical protein [Clostridium rhizosphaerae]MBL4937571.1 hypothetical protein [Clostridium rhizosphaerae]